VAEKFPDTGIIFVGSTNPDHYEVDTYVVKKVKRLARTYQGKRIFFVERTHETEKYYQAADIFVMPSLREGLPNAMLEAMSCELPVVVSRLEGVTDWVVENDVNGLLISPGNGGELSEALIRLLGDAELSNALGKKARKTIKKRFRIEKMAGKYEKLYKNPSIN
jgi:glycosyltransferase involved in cell wall biosynthesis